jgi:hypothetical protein
MNNKAHYYYFRSFCGNYENYSYDEYIKGVGQVESIMRKCKLEGSNFEKFFLQMMENRDVISIMGEKLKNHQKA